MNLTQISLEQTGRFNRLILDYINADPATAEFYSLPHSLGSYKEQITKRSLIPVNRELLSTALLNQYQAMGGAKDKVAKNIESLNQGNTYTVTTGHQLNIFTGPLYFIYKIFHTIRLAEELNEAYPENKFVPVYWMNSEDHDLEEVGQFNLYGKKYTWNTDQTGATGKLDSISLSALCDQLDEVFSNDEETMKLISLFRKAYSEFGNLAKATRYFVNELFGEYGLVIIDSDDASLKASFKEYLKKDILENKPYELVRSTSKRLDEAGYKVQVNPRQINCFYLADGVRERIVQTDNGFHVLHTDIRFAEEELLAELESHPERFSPNVVLRPLFQEFILPNLTYVGGAGELSYWLQYKEYFAEMNVSFPLLSLRNHFVLIDGGIGSKMDNLNLMPQDLFQSIDSLVNDHLIEISATELDFSAEQTSLAELYASLKDKAADIDQSLVGALEAEEKKQEKAIGQWASRFSRALKQQNENSINQIRKIHSKLFPFGYLQERHDNFLAFHSKYRDDFFSAIHENTEPFSTAFRVLRLD